MPHFPRAAARSAALVLSLGLPIELAVETRLGCEHCTFYEEGVDAMRAVIDTMENLLGDHPTYTGFAVHDFDGFVALAR